MKIILHTRTPVFDDKGAFQIHDAGEELELAPELAEQLIAKGAASLAPLVIHGQTGGQLIEALNGTIAGQPTKPAKPAKPAA